MGTGYQLTLELSRRFEIYRQGHFEQLQQEKRTEFSREFRGSPARGRGHSQRGQHNRPPKPEPPPARGASARSYFSGMP